MCEGLARLVVASFQRERGSVAGSFQKVNVARWEVKLVKTRAFSDSIVFF